MKERCSYCGEDFLNDRLFKYRDLHGKENLSLCHGCDGDMGDMFYDILEKMHEGLEEDEVEA